MLKNERKAKAAHPPHVWFTGLSAAKVGTGEEPTSELQSSKRAIGEISWERNGQSVLPKCRKHVQISGFKDECCNYKMYIKHQSQSGTVFELEKSARLKHEDTDLSKSSIFWCAKCFLHRYNWSSALQELKGGDRKSGCEINKYNWCAF